MHGDDVERHCPGPRRDPGSLPLQPVAYTGFGGPTIPWKCTITPDGNVQHQAGGGAMASQHEKLQNNHEQAVNAARKGFASGE